jgi:hypothetical protein
MSIYGVMHAMQTDRERYQKTGSGIKAPAGSLAATPGFVGGGFALSVKQNG